jgi:hypothetical protein
MARKKHPKVLSDVCAMPQDAGSGFGSSISWAAATDKLSIDARKMNFQRQSIVGSCSQPPVPVSVRMWNGQ